MTAPDGLHVRTHDAERPAVASGEPPVVVLVHGAMDRAAAFAKVAAQLHDHRVVRYDRRGYGRSRHAGDPAVGVDGHAEDLLAVIDAHAGGRAVVVGHSFGGVVALVAAGRRPDAVAAIGAYETPMPWAPWWPATSLGLRAVLEGDERGTGAAAERFLRLMIGDDRFDDLGPTVQATRRAEGAALVAELRSVRGDEAPAPDLGAVSCPVRSAHGTRAKPHHRRAAEELARLAGDGIGPTVVDGAGHGCHISHPEAFASWVRTITARS